jgi:hypothetical protein
MSPDEIQNVACPDPSVDVPTPIADTKLLRQQLDSALQNLKCSCGLNNKPPIPSEGQRNSCERSLAITKIQEAIMWLGMDLKSMSEEGLGGSNPYPQPIP